MNIISERLEQLYRDLKNIEIQMFLKGNSGIKCNTKYFGHKLNLSQFNRLISNMLFEDKTEKQLMSIKNQKIKEISGTMYLVSCINS